jgi:hypothetical protein
MKQKLTTTMLGIAFLLAFQFLNATVEPATKLKPVIKENIATNPQPLNLRTLEEFLSLTPKKYTELTGKKMTLPQKVSLKIAQHKVKRAIKKGQSVDLNALSKDVDTSNFNIGGFVLGLLLGIIGVLIAYLVGDHDVVKWAWIGFAVWVGIVLLVLIL